MSNGLRVSTKAAERIQQVLQRLLELSRADSVWLVSGFGREIAVTGDVGAVDAAGFSSLVASIDAAAQEALSLLDGRGGRRWALLSSGHICCLLAPVSEVGTLVFVSEPSRVSFLLQAGKAVPRIGHVLRDILQQ
ncbi:MAG: hypothetical protein Kow00109_21250 [Acidobacteriota bacterium]